MYFLRFGDGKCSVLDVIDFRLEKAKEFGADVTYKIETETEESDVAKGILESFREEPDVVIDCSGAESSLRLSIQVIKRNGVLVLVGLGRSTMNLPIPEILFKEIDVRGCFRYCNE